MCEAEVRLNRRTGADTYRDVLPITRRADGGLALGGDGAPVDWVVEMNRFDQRGLFDRLAVSGGLSSSSWRRWHRRSPGSTGLPTAPRPWGQSRNGMGDRGKRGGLRRIGRTCLDPAAVSHVIDDSWHELNELRRRVRQVLNGGYVPLNG